MRKIFYAIYFIIAIMIVLRILGILNISYWIVFAPLLLELTFLILIVCIYKVKKYLKLYWDKIK